MMTYKIFAETAPDRHGLDFLTRRALSSMSGFAGMTSLI